MPVPSTVQPLTRSLAREDIYRTLKQWIVNLQLAPDELIRDQELAAQLGVSRTPVREALRRLEDEGLVVTSFHKWTKVAPTDAAEMAHLYPAIAALEAMAVELALPHVAASDLTQLDTLNKALALAIQQGEVEKAATLDRQFHELIVQKSKNTEIEKMLSTLRPRIKRLELAHFGNTLIARQSVKEHKTIVSALRRGDARAAADAMKQNWLLGQADDPVQPQASKKSAS
jgi:DNA-binding GntR family transcriptional regulator